MEVTHSKYPSLLFLSYNEEDAPDELPFEVASVRVRDYLEQCTGYHELFAYAAAKNSLEGRNTALNYLLPDQLYQKVDGATQFRNEHFQAFFTSYVKPQHGVILLPRGGQYVFLLLGKHETKQLHNQAGRYMAVALFKENFFIGFEECLITEKGIQVFQTGHYEGGMDVGGYISFCIITLAYANGRQLKELELPGVRETIYEL